MDSRTATPFLTLPTRVLCVDDSHDVTLAMRMVIDTDARLQYVGCLASADRLVETARRMNPPPDVVLLDATMPGKNPLAAMSEMAAEFPEIKTILYTGISDPAFIDRAKGAGAWGYVSKNEEPDAILRAVRKVAAGNAWWPRFDHGA